MNKAELAAYLVNLHTLMAAQTSASTAIPSNTLALEYEKHWAMLKESIANEDREPEEKGLRR